MNPLAVKVSSLSPKNGLFFILFFTYLADVSLSIGCYKCQSHGGTNPTCEDPFHTNYTNSVFEEKCMGGRKDRDGLFPATSCIKLSGVYEDTKEIMVVRGCALDSGTLTIDTELVRMSHCGGFYFNDRYVRGCIQSCSEEACNHSFRPRISAAIVPFIPTVIFLLRSESMF
ncbi:Uncharacterised protein g9154 [Pycnogonum litorale]